MFIALILIIWGCWMIRKSIKNKKKLEAQGTFHGKTNPYIAAHSEKLKDDYLYKEYLKWCEGKGQIPVDKIGFENIRKREKALFESLHQIGIKGHEY